MQSSPSTAVAVLDSPSPEPSAPHLGTTALDEHKDRQRAYRELMATMAAEDPQAEDAPVAPAPLTAEQIAEREGQGALGAYLAALAEMADSEPRYVVGLRPPRPRFAGLLLEVGDVVPGAHAWPRLESWVRSGIVTPAPVTRG